MSQYVFFWKIENYLLNACCERECLTSPSFTVEIFSNIKWFLRLYPDYVYNGKNCIFCHLVRGDDEGPVSFRAEFDISCVAADGQVQFLPDYRQMWDFKRGSYAKWDVLISTLLQKRRFYFPDDSFTIRCRLWSLEPLTEQLVSNTCTALTRIEVMKKTFKKSLCNFSAVFSSHKVTFPVTLTPKLKIAIYLAELSSDYISVDIIKCDESDMILLACKLSVLDSDGMTLDCKEDRHTFRSGEVNAVWKFSPFIEVQKLKDENILFDDTLHLRFQFSFSAGRCVSRIIKGVLPSEMVDDRLSGIESLSADLECLFEEKKFSDVKLKSENETLPAHKAILCARSPVFAAMFGSDMYENENGLVDIIDVSTSTLKKMLLFMYTGNIEMHEEKTALDLLIAADKYQVLPLKEKCSYFLERNITVENAVQILLLADMHQAKELKIYTEKFICDHKQEIFTPEVWEGFMKEHTTIARELFLHK